MARARHTLLVVDDEPDVVKSVQDLLRLDYRVLGATTAADGMKLMSGEEVHLVMSDQRMPEMTGVEFLSRVRGEHPEAVRLLFTGYADIHAVIDAINHGNVYRYITKPWDPDELQSVIREAAERYDLLVERKRLLEQLRDQNQQLETANAELLKSNQLKKAFIAVASHELRTPLAILLGMTKLTHDSPKLEPSLRPWVGRIDAAARRLQHLVDQIIAMMQAGRFEAIAERQPTDLAALLNAAADDVRPFIALRNQRLDVQVPADLGNAAVEAAKIRDSINHLLLNAIKFTPDGGAISLKARGVDTGSVEIVVQDTGPGIGPEVLERMFEPFFTGFDVTHHSSGQFEFGRKGIGLGLSVVKAFITMHGGTIRVESRNPQGTTFTILLPRKDGPNGEGGSGSGTVGGAAGIN